MRGYAEYSIYREFSHYYLTKTVSTTMFIPVVLSPVDLIHSDACLSLAALQIGKRPRLKYKFSFLHQTLTTNLLFRMLLCWLHFFVLLDHLSMSKDNGVLRSTCYLQYKARSRFYKVCDERRSKLVFVSAMSQLA